MDLAWTSAYPDKVALKSEATAMAEACAEGILSVAPRDAIVGIYWKGSARKPWDSLVDYVPELSDVDIHVLFADDAGPFTHLGTPEEGAAAEAEIERRFLLKVPHPIHMPRPQILPLNKLHQMSDFVPSPAATVGTLYGRELEAPDYSDVARLRGIAREQLLKEAGDIANLSWVILDKPGRYLWTALRGLTWHIAPIAPKVLLLDGVPPQEAWSMNRTALIARLEAGGREDLARDYAGFYLAGWRFFLSGWMDSDAGREAFMAGVRVMREGARIGATA